MSDSDKAFPDFGKLVPGFDFLQNLTRQASASVSSGLPQMPSMPSMGHWVAPTLSVEELNKRIQELKTVQFWLDQNATALKATIQALEVQKMTLSALAGMNVNMNEMAKAFSVKMPEAMGGAKAAAPQAPPLHQPHHFAGLEVPETSYQKREHTRDEQRENAQARADATPEGSAAQDPSAAASVPAALDPLQWWSALTQQFQHIASAALKDVSARSPLEAGAGLAQDAFKGATDFAGTASQTLAKGASSARDMMSGALRSADGWPLPQAAGAGAARQRKVSTGSSARGVGQSAAQSASKAGKTSTGASARNRSASSASPSERASAKAAPKGGKAKPASRAAGVAKHPAAVTRKAPARAR